MDRETVIRLAREAGLLGILDKYAHEFLDGVFDLDVCGELERFAALVEQHAIFSGIHTCNPGCQRPACVAVREAVAAEREQCAKVCESEWSNVAEKMYGQECAAAIRSRT